jgi:hypothetical protein
MIARHCDGNSCVADTMSAASSAPTSVSSGRGAPESTNTSDQRTALPELTGWSSETSSGSRGPPTLWAGRRTTRACLAT